MGGLRKNGDHKKWSSKFWIQGVEPSVCARLSACYLLVSFLHLETLGSLLVSFFLAFGKGVQGVEPPASYLLIAAKKASFFSCKKSLLLYLRMRRRAWSRN